MTRSDAGGNGNAAAGFRSGLAYVKGRWPHFVVAAYAAIGIGVFFVLHARASVYLEMLGTSTYTFSVEEAFSVSTFWVPAIFLAISFTTLACDSGKPGSRLRGAAPLLVTLVLTGYTLIAFRGVTGASNASNISYLFALDGVIGISLYLLFTRPQQTTAQSYEEASGQLLSLRMEHKELLQHINLTIWSMVLIFTGAVVAALIPRITSLQGTLTQFEASGFIFLNFAILIIYFLIGVWFGVIGQLLSRLEKVRKNALAMETLRESFRLRSRRNSATSCPSAQ